MSSILRISEAVSLGIHAVVLIGSSHGEKISAANMAEMIDASEAHLAKVLQRLCKDGIVKSERGPKGGFVLGRAAEEITLMNVYEAIEGAFPNGDCMFTAPVCGRQACLLGGFIIKMNREAADFFRKTKLSDVVAKNLE